MKNLARAFLLALLISSCGMQPQEQMEKNITDHETKTKDNPIEPENFEFTFYRKESLRFDEAPDFNAMRDSVSRYTELKKDAQRWIEMQEDIYNIARMYMPDKEAIERAKLDSIRVSDSLIGIVLESFEREYEAKRDGFVPHWFYKISVTDRAGGTVAFDYLLDTTTYEIRFRRSNRAGDDYELVR